MINKQMATKIVATLLVAAMALPSAGIVTAAKNVPTEFVEEEAGDFGKSLRNMIRSVFSKNGSWDSSNDTGTNTNTDTNSSGLEEVVTLTVKGEGEFVYGDSLEGKLTVEAVSKKENKPIEGFQDYVLKYYDKNDKDLGTIAPKNVGSYKVIAYAKDGSHYLAKGSEPKEFEIVPKPITVKLPVNERVFIDKGEFPKTYKAELAEGSKLAYDEVLFSDFSIPCDVVKDGEVVNADKFALGKYTLKAKVGVRLKLSNGEETENYTVNVEDGSLVVVEKLTLTVTGKAVGNSFGYGDYKLGSEAFTVEAKDSNENPVELEPSRISLSYYIDMKNESLPLTAGAMPKNVGAYFVEADYEGDVDKGDYKAGTSEKVRFEITKREIEISLESQSIKNGETAPTEEALTEALKITGLGENNQFPYEEDGWERSPSAYYKNGVPDTTKEGEYAIIVEASVKDPCADNYDVKFDNPAATLTVAPPEGKEKSELKLDLKDVSVVYGEDAVEALAKEISVTDKDGNTLTEDIAANKYEFQYIDSEGKALEQAPVNAGSYKVKAVFKEDAAYKEAVSNEANLTIIKKPISVKAKTYGIANGDPLPELGAEAVEIEGSLAYDDAWKTVPGAKYEKSDIDTKTADKYVIEAVAEVEEGKKDNYEIKLENAFLYVAELNTETGKSKVDLRLVNEDDALKVYDGTAFDQIKKESVTNHYGYNGELEFNWQTKDHVAPTDAGKYTLLIQIPDGIEKWEGSLEVTVTIAQRGLTLHVVPKERVTEAGVPVKCDIVSQNFVKGEEDKWVVKPTVKITSGDVNKKGSYSVQAAGGEPGSNYKIDGYGDPIEITVNDPKKPLIDADVTFGKKTEYVYTGEQIRPAVTVTCTYNNGKKDVKQKLKLNVDYVVTYSDNVNVAYSNTGAVIAGAKATITGIGEYAGYIEKNFTITPKSMKKVTLSAVGDIKMGEEPALVVMDGIYELSSDDYDILVKTGKNGSSGVIVGEKYPHTQYLC